MDREPHSILDSSTRILNRGGAFGDPEERPEPPNLPTREPEDPKFESELAVLHPSNQNIRPKIRQQLQLLVTRGIIRRELLLTESLAP